MRFKCNYTVYFLILFILSFFALHASNAFADIIIDNGDPGTSYTGTWAVSGGTSPYGANSLWSRDGDTYTWQFSSQPAGVYEIYMWWSGYASRATNIAVTINSSTGSQVIYINQQQNAGKWNSLGQYTFNSSGRVTITAANGSSVSTCADAVKFVYISGSGDILPTAYIDSISPNPATVGQSVQFTGHGADTDGSVVAYEWDSNINGLLSNSASFNTSSLSAGTHTISFKVQDNAGTWSTPVTETLVVGSASTEIIIDNGDPGTSYTGTWAVSGGTSPYGANSLWSRDGDTYTWQFSSQPAGVYEVYMWWSGYASRATNIAVTINSSTGSQVIYINQQQNAGKWNSLGQYTFNSSGRVTITAANGSSVSTCADAVKFVYISGVGNTPPVAYIDSISPNPATVGQSVQFTGHGADTDGSVVAYEWDSSIDGLLSNSASFNTSSLSSGTHTISFKVQDNAGAWSTPVTQTLVVGSASTTQIIIDNRDAATSSTGTWGVSSASGQYGADSVWSRDGATFTWNFTPPITGQYELSMWWTYWSSRSTNVPVDIQYAGGTVRVSINQQQNGSQWNVLGTYPFTAGVSYKVTITAQPGPSSTCADAVKFVYISGGGGGNTPPVAYIDSISPNPATVGQSVQFTGHGADTDGTIMGYNWRSSIDGQLSSSASFSISTLSVGSHTISLKVQDDKGAWSQEVSKTLDISDQASNTEHIYLCPIYFAAPSTFTSFLQSIGAVQEGDIWKYTNTAQNKDYIIHIVTDIDSARQAMYTDGAHIILMGHSNYGLGGIFATEAEAQQGHIDNIYYIDDDRIFNYSSPWIAVSVRGEITGQAYPNWWPIFKDGTSGIMPFNFGDPRGDPPYNYYITYQVPGDSTYYQVRGLQRFPDSGKPAWYSPNGIAPDPTNPSQQQYYITNPNASVNPNRLCGSQVCPPNHYGSKTIIFRKENEIDISKLKYKRMLYDACTSGNYYLDTFHHGLMFYTIAGSGGGGTFVYLKAYLEGKSDKEIWQLMQAYSACYDYYDFNKRPSEQ